MALTPKFQLPYLAAGARGNIEVANKNFAVLEQLTQVKVISRLLQVEPTSPAEGDLYLLPSVLTGSTNYSWQGHTGELALYYDGAWVFIPVSTGLIIWDLSASTPEALVYDGNFFQTFGQGRSISHTQIGPVTAGFNIPLFKSNGAIILGPQWGIIQSGTSVSLQLNYGPDPTLTGSTASSLVITSSTTGTYDPGGTTIVGSSQDDWLWLSVQTVSGAVDVFNWTLQYSTSNL